MQLQGSHIALSFDHHTVVLAVRCPECRGEGLARSEGPEAAGCPLCAGAGLAPTREGRAVLDLVRLSSGKADAGNSSVPPADAVG